MPLRLLEATVPHEAIAGLPALIEEVPTVHVRTLDLADGNALISILLDARQVETMSDLLVARYGGHDSFRLILLSVEATLPTVLPSQADSNGNGLASADSVGTSATEPSAAVAERISREELYEDIAHASQLTPVFLVMVALSTVVAVVGLIRGDVALLIGAMVIAPLLGPNVALSLAATLGDLELAKRSLRVIGSGVATAMVLSLLLGAVLHVDPTAPEIAARTQPRVGDVALALAAGTAGALAFTSGVSGVVVGVMVAVALLPLLVVAGLLFGAGYSTQAAGALVLVLTNVTCVNLAAVATFLSQRVSPRTWWETDRANRSTRLAIAAWIALLAVLLALILSGAVGLD